jgi:polyhydroxybutyrate depolymerase
MTVESVPKLKPKPVMHIAGEKDALVKFEWQERTIAAVRKINGCEPLGKQWAKDCTLYPSKSGTPVIAYIHPGGHVVPAEGPPLIVKFFQEISK